MSKKRSVKSYLMMAKYHSKKDSASSSSEATQKQKQEQKQKQKSSDLRADEVGQDNFGAQTSDERTTATTTTNEAANSIAGDSSSGYHSVANQFYPARHQAQQQQQRRQLSATERFDVNAMKLAMVNERISGVEKSRDTQQHMWSAMIDDGGANESGCNKVHLIDDDDGDDDIDVDVDIDSYDIDVDVDVDGGAEDNNNISDRFHRHRYCVDSAKLSSSSTQASRFDESFQLERQRLHQAHPHHLRQQQQYFQPNYHHHSSSSQFQPSLEHHQQQQQSLLNGPVSSSAAAAAAFNQQQQQRFVNYYTRQQPADDRFAAATVAAAHHHYPIPLPASYSQQQFHSLVQYNHPQQHPYSYTAQPTSSNQHFTAAARGKPLDNLEENHPERSQAIGEPINYQSLASYSQHNNLPSLTPSGATATKMQPASSRQYLTSADSHHQQQQQQQPPSHKSSSSRRQVAPSSGTHNSRKLTSTIIKANKPALDCCGKLAKLLLFTTNLLFWSAGIALGAWGILALVEDHKYNLSQLLVFEPNTRMSLFQLLAWSFITLGCATILVGFCGCSAIFKNNRWILGLYIFLVLAIFALDLATGLLAIIFQEKLVANVRLRLANKLRADYGVQASFTAAIDYIQTRFECCGLEGHFDYDQSVWRLQRLGGFEATVARTCCHLRNTFDDQAHINPRPVNESMCQSTDIRFHQSYRYRKGCLDDLERLVRHKIWTFTMGCAAVGGVILISLMFATCFCRSIQSYTRGKESPPASAAASPKHHPDQSGSNKQRHFSTSPSATGQRQHHQHHHHQHQHQHHK